MRTSLLFFMLLFNLLITAQEVTPGLKTAFKTDNPDLLFKTLGNTSIDQCFLIKNNNYHLLSLAIKTKAINCFTALLEKGADTESDCSAKTPLLYAVKYGELDMLKLLVAKGANTKVVNRGRTAIDYALKYERKEIVKYLSSL